MRRPPRRAPPPWYHRISPMTWVLLWLLLALSVSWTLYSVRPLSVAPHPIQVQVMNGSGVPDLAQRATSVLRAKGIDVVFSGNADSQQYRDTIVLQRRGDLQLARHVAAVLGRGEVLEQLDPSLLVDVTVFLGRDYAAR